MSFITKHSAQKIITNAFSSTLSAKKDWESGRTSETKSKRQMLDRNSRHLRNVERFLILVANCEARGREPPPLPRNLTSRLQSNVESRGGVFEWAKSRPEYAKIKKQKKDNYERSPEKNAEKLITKRRGCRKHKGNIQNQYHS